MDESIVIFNLIYFMFSYCLIYPPTEFIAAGITLNHLCGSFLGSETIQFIQYHRRRTCLTLIVHSLLPIFYVFLYFLQFNELLEYEMSNFFKFMLWNSMVFSSIGIPICSAMTILYWWLDEWDMHPITVNLKKYTNNDNNWQLVAASVNDEFRRPDMMVSKINAISTVIATENWVIKTTPYTVHFAHQSDTALIAVKSDTHQMSQDSNDLIQFVSIIVKPTRPKVSEFSIRVNALNFKDLQDRINRPITILSGVQFNKTIIERFIDAFREQIKLNPKYKCEQITDSCFACMIAEPNVKLNKQCADIDGNGDMRPVDDRCGNCYCRPMWCVDCLATWFASKQNQYEKDVWLAQKCTCPMCRVPFCILDVCFVEKN